jgi:chromosome segregation ATPase
MRTVKLSLLALLMLHLLAAGAGLGWLIATGRVSGERLAQVKETFELPVSQEQQQEQKAAELAEAAEAEAARMARLAGLGEASTASERLAEENKRNEILLRQLERTRSEIESLQDNLHLARQRMERQNEQVSKTKQELQQKLTEIENRLNDEGFKKAVALYETLPPKQVKAMFAELMDNGQTDQVVAYLEAMQSRRAAAVLKEFKDPIDVQRAVELTERLRARGSELVQDVEDAA